MMNVIKAFIATVTFVTLVVGLFYCLSKCLESTVAGQSLDRANTSTYIRLHH